MNALIVNADDFGISQGTSVAVSELATAGAISSTSIMVNMPFVEDIRTTIAANPRLGVGLHVNLSQGRPVLDPGTVRTLVDADGQFHSPRELVRRTYTGRVSLSEVRHEVIAQIQRARDLVGARLDHWDSHQGTHRFEPLATVVIAACADQAISAMRTHRHRFVTRAKAPTAAPAPLTRRVKEAYYRWLTHRAAAHFAIPDALLAVAGGTCIDTLAYVVDIGAPDGIVEIPCHPASSADGLPQTRMVASRVAEYEFLRGSAWSEAIRSGRVRLMTYADLSSLRTTGGRRREQLAPTTV